MRIPQIQIQTTDIQMNYQTTDPVQRIEQPQADIQIDQPAAILEINTTNPQLNIDMTQLWRDLGLQSTKETIRMTAQQGQQAVLQGISKKVSEGRQLMMGAGKGGNTIKQLAIQEFGAKRPGPYNIDFIPSYQAIKVAITPGTTEVNIEQQQPKIDVQVNKPVHDYTPGSINGTMVTRPDVQIDVMG